MTKRVIKIAIDGGDFYPFGIVNSGIKRIIDSFLKNVSTPEGYEVIINYYFFGKKTPIDIPEYLSYSLLIKRLPTRFFSSFFLPFQVIRDKNDVYIGFSSVTPHFLGYTSIKKISFLYDLGFITYPSLYQNHERMIDHTIQTIILADKLIVLSAFAKKEILHGLEDIEKNKIIVKYPGNDHIKIPKRTKPIIAGSYFLFVGVIKPIKNIDRLIKIFSEFKLKDNSTKLVIVGRAEQMYKNSLLKSPEYIQNKKDIIFRQDQTDTELMNLYQHAKAVINVSMVEGLGFPVLESLSIGKIVIVNDLPIYNEFKNKYTNLWIGENDKKIISLMRKSINYKMVTKKRELFTWKEFTETIIQVAIDLLKRRK